MKWEPLLAAAGAAQRHAHCPYSGFAVGAAFETESGEIFVGANVENRSYGVTICAERSAVAAAVSAGHRRFRAVVIVTPSTPPGPPCGLCRETMTEFCDPDLPILLANPQGERRMFSLGELFPEPFRLPEGETSGG
ncbi:MAG: cytidine deaminase [Thermoanaerobaculia bacterium]